MAERQDLERRHDLRQDLDRLKEDMYRLRSDISELAQKLVNIGRSESRVARDRFVEGSHQALDMTRDRGRRTAETLGQRVEERPLVSLLAAFIAGLFLGGLSRMRSRNSGY